MTDKDGKSKERYCFLFKSRILVCKVRRISEDRSIFLLKDIIKLPEVEIKDQPNGVVFEIHAKSEHPSAWLPLNLKAHKDGVKAYWFTEINNYAGDPLALHEHNADDLRIDPTCVKPDELTEAEDVFRLHRKASYESDGIKPSEVAKDHFLTPEEREQYAKQLLEEQQLLQLQQKSFVQRKCQQVSSVQEIASDGLVTQTKVVEHSREEIVASKGADEKHAKLVRSSAVERSEEIQVQQQNSVEQRTSSEVKREAIKHSSESKQQQSEVKTNVGSSGTTAASVKPKVTFVEKSSVKSRVEEPSEPTVVHSGNNEDIVSLADEHKLLHPINATAFATADSQLEISTANVVDACPITLLSAATNPSARVHTVEQQLALCTTPSARTKPSPQDGGSSGGGQQQSKGNTNTSSSASGNTNRSTVVWDSSGNRLQTISRFCFRDCDGSGPPGLPPISNVPDFLIPRHLITYETSFEIHIRKIPNPPPPPPPCYIRKLLVHTESLEQKTRAILTGSFETGPTDASLRTARRKIRSLKSTILKSDDEVKHAEDTIHKAQSGDFLNIINPPIIEKPLYEFIEVPSERSEEECSEFSDRRSERAISELGQVQQQDNMEDYYTSRYSSRSSRRQIEGKWKIETISGNERSGWIVLLSVSGHTLTFKWFLGIQCSQ